jgi:H+/Cl- antiporter ClcA
LRVPLEGVLYWPTRYDTNVLPVPSVVIVFTLLAYAVAGMAIGAFSGWLASLITKCRPRLVLRGAFLGSFGFLAGFIGCIFMPWPTNTIIEPLEGGGAVTTTMNMSKHVAHIELLLSWLFSCPSSTKSIDSSERVPN